MDRFITKLTSNDSDFFFGCRRSDYPLGSDVFESVLRYIALKHGGCSPEEVKRISVYEGRYNSRSAGDNYVSSDTDFDIRIYRSEDSSSPLNITSTGWESVESSSFPVASFLSKHASETTAYINNEKKQVIVFVKSATQNWIYRFCATIFRFLPWFYHETPSGAELALFRALNEKNNEEIQRIINDYYDSFGIDFTAIKTMKELNDWDKALKKQRYESLCHEHDNITSGIASYEKSISELLDKLAIVNDNLKIVAMMDEDGGKVAEFFAQHKQLSVYEIDNCGTDKLLFFNVTGVIENYDDEEFLRSYDNPKSFMADYNSERRELMYGLFALKKGFVKTTCVMKLTNLSSLVGVSNTIDDEKLIDRIPHPHIYYHACLGENSAPIHSYFASGDWDMALEQAIVAATNINFGDITVFNKLMRDLDEARTTKKCILADNGVDMTPAEFVEYLRATKEKTEE